MSATGLAKGSYVVATKYSDGDPGDQFCIGFYDQSYDHYGQTRHIVLDSLGNSFRHNGFRRVEQVTHERGSWMVENIHVIEQYRNSYSVWDWFLAPWGDWVGA